MPGSSLSCVGRPFVGETTCPKETQGTPVGEDRRGVDWVEGGNYFFPNPPFLATGQPPCDHFHWGGCPQLAKFDWWISPNCQAGRFPGEIAQSCAIPWFFWSGCLTIFWGRCGPLGAEKARKVMVDMPPKFRGGMPTTTNRTWWSVLLLPRVTQGGGRRAPFLAPWSLWAG